MALATVPGLFALLRSRSLVPRADDPAFPERLFALRRELAQVSGVALSGSLLAAPSWAPWLLPLGLAGAAAGAFPVRRAAFGETWGLGAYLSHLARLTLAFAGFWLALGLLPLLLWPLPWPAWLLAAGLLQAWSAAHPHLARLLLRARSLDRPDLLPRLDAVSSRSSARRPAILVAGARGGRWVNAFALPSTGRPGVLLTEDLLLHFDADEVAAVFAHEVAHLEHFDRRRLRLAALAIAVAVALGTVALPSLLRQVPAQAPLLGLVWTVAVTVALVVRLARHKSHEAESDRRAVELCQDPEALVRALAKLTAMMRLPRRWSEEMERTASHPSLASRIHAIRRGASPPPPAALPHVVVSPAAARAVVLDADAAEWLEGLEAGGVAPADVEELRRRARSRRRLAYGDLRELRVQAGVGGSPALLARDLRGRSWTVPLAPGDVAALQLALDHAEGRLAPLRFDENPVLTTLLATAAFLLSMTTGGSVVAVPALVATFRAPAAVLAALGATALGQSALTLASGRATRPAAFLLAVGLLALFLAVRRVRAGRGGAGIPFVLAAAGLALTGGLSGLVLVSAALLGSLSLPGAAALWPGSGLALLGIGAGLLTLPSRLARVAGLLALLAGLVPLALAALPGRQAAEWSLEATTAAARARPARAVSASPRPTAGGR